MTLLPEERDKIRETETLKKEIRDELEAPKRESGFSKFFQHQAVLLILGFIFTTAVGSWLTYYWKKRDWANQQSYLAAQRALDKKYTVIDRTFKEVAITVTAGQDVLAGYIWTFTAIEIKERRTNWLKTSRDWRIASDVLRQSIAVNFKNADIQKTFKDIVDARTQLGNGITRLPPLPEGSKRKANAAREKVRPEVDRLNDLSNHILDLLQECGTLMAAETKPPSLQ